MILSEKLSKNITNILIDNSIIDNCQSDAYIYCLDFAFDLIFFNMSLLIIGLFTHSFFLSLLYIITLVPIKMLAGGAHAKNVTSCSIISYIVYILTLISSHIISFITYINIPIIILTGIGICILAPVEHINKRYDAAIKKKIKKYCILNLAFIYILLIVMLLLKLYIYCNLIILCLCIVFFNQLIGLLINGDDKNAT
ncbi:MAG: accessory gene regulator B family protein [Lachnospiraceae bacterium]|nr:accessory gene regulator B family protein [Lachnospiraceae bacterium]